MGSIFRSGGGGGGSIFRHGSAPLAPTDPSAPSGGGKKGGGFLGSVEHVFAQGGKDLYHAAINAPAGVVQEVVDPVVAHLKFAAEGGKRPPTFFDTTVKPTVKAVAQDFQHPLRHPGNTLLDVLPIGEGLGRLGEAGAVARAGGTAGDVAKTLANRAEPAPRTFQHEGLKVDAPASRTALGRAAQKTYDKQVLARSEGMNARRVGKELAKNRQVAEGIERGPAAALVAAGKTLKPEQQTAIRTVAEGAKTDERVAYHQGRARGVGKAERARHEDKIQLLERSRQFLDETGAKPRIAAEHPDLQRLYAQTLKVAKGRETLLEQIGKMTPDAAQGRLQGPGRIVTGGEFKGTSAKGKRGQIVGGDATGGEARIPYTFKRAPRSLGSTPMMGGGDRIGYPKTPSSVTQPFKGGLLKTANFRDDTTRLVGESNLEAQRLGSLLRLREDLKQAVKPEPTNEKYDIPMRLDNLKSGTLKPDEQALLHKVESGAPMTPKEHEHAAGLFETVRSRIFPLTEKMTEEDHAAYAKLHDEGKIGWVDSRLLRGMGRPAPKLEALLGRGPTKGLDAINNAARLGIFYAKGPGFVVPNVLGNTALNLIHQGFLAAPNFARALTMEKRLGAETAGRIDEVMGEGVSQSLAGGQGRGAGAINKLAAGYSRITDRPFRRSAFEYEARRAGYRTPEQIQQLVTDPEHRKTLVHVSRRANAEVLNYDDLTPREQELARRIAFVYPFIKANAKYTKTFVQEHPGKAAVASVVGQNAYEQNKRDLAPFPSYFEGAFKVGGTNSDPTVVNPNGVSPLQVPAQIGAALAEVLTGHRSDVATPSNFASPATSFVTDLVSGQGVRKAITNQVTGLPHYLLAQRLLEAERHQGKSRVYLPTLQNALAPFLIGSVAPRQVSRQGLGASAAKELQRSKRGG